MYHSEVKVVVSEKAADPTVWRTFQCLDGAVEHVVKRVFEMVIKSVIWADGTKNGAGTCRGYYRLK